MKGRLALVDAEWYARPGRGRGSNMAAGSVRFPLSEYHPIDPHNGAFHSF
jgi:hypothetical protein